MRIKSGILFLLLCGIPFLLLAGAEVALRTIGYGQDYALFIPCPDKESGTYIINSRFYARNFSGEIKKSVENAPAWGMPLQQKKKEGTFRIFVLGGSVALGDVPEQAFNIPRYLEVMLQASFPGTHFEIHNLACFALGSPVMRDAAEQAAAFSPDLFCVYMGNNEYVGNFLSRWFQGSRLRSAAEMRLLFKLQQCRLLQLAQSFYPEFEDPLLASWSSYFKNAFPLAPNSSGREQMYWNYASNLHDIYASAQRAGTGMLVCSVAANIAAMPPLGSVHRTDLTESEKEQWDHYFSTACALMPEQPALALEHFREALEIDDTFALLHFHMGECFLLLKQFAEAKKSFQCACDFDAHPVRADSRINAVIRQLVKMERESGILFADVEKNFSDAAESGVIGQEYCYDYVHLNLEGNYQVASMIFDAIKDFVAQKTGRSPVKEKLDYPTASRYLGLSPLLELKCIDAMLEEQERFRVLFPDYLPGRYALVKQKAEAALPESAVDDALEAIDSALEIRGEDLQLRRLRCEILWDAGRAKEMHQEAQKILAHFGDTPLGAFTARSFILADGQ